MSAIQPIRFNIGVNWKTRIYLDWSQQLATDSDTISTVSWSIPSPLSNTDNSNTTTSTVTFVQGGVVDNTYTGTCTIGTTLGQTFDVDVIFRVI